MPHPARDSHNRQHESANRGDGNCRPSDQLEPTEHEHDVKLFADVVTVGEARMHAALVQRDQRVWF